MHAFWGRITSHNRRCDIAEEIKDVGKAEQRELARRVAVLLAHLLKWQHQLGRRGSSWTRAQGTRKAIAPDPKPEDITHRYRLAGGRLG